jgi:hypothetical protein
MNTQVFTLVRDGSPWVMNSFDNLLLPKIHKLNPFHVSRAGCQIFGPYLDSSVLVKTLIAERLEVAIIELHACIQKTHKKPRNGQKKQWASLELSQSIDQSKPPRVA